MKVLMQNRVDAFTNKGGDTVQMLKTKEELEKLGVEVDISLDLEPNLDKYEIIHLFNVSRVNETWMQFMNAKKYNKKIVVSTIYHSKREIRDYENHGLIGAEKFINYFFKNENTLENVKTIVRFCSYPKEIKSVINQFKIGYLEQQKYIIENADVLLPNSKKELEVLKDEIMIGDIDDKSIIVPNGIEIDFMLNKNDQEYLDEKLKFKNYILCVGRIEPLKNQLKVIEAFKNTNEFLVFVGKINKKHRGYYKKFIKEVKNSNNILYLGELKSEDMYYVYKNAKITVMASWFETTGLTGIESIFSGTKAVVTNKGYTKEYYSNYVEYCDPNDSYSIKNAVEKSLKKDFTLEYEFKNFINENFTWEKAAYITKSVYDNLV